jgi:hypothetical protein
MKLVNTVTKFVAGSNKYFDIFECKVDEVEAYTSASDKLMIKVTIEGTEYSGLHNKWVYDFLCENEGTDSFVVMWRAPKGDHMLAYVKDIWVNHLESNDKNESIKEENIPDREEGEAFVYMWVDHNDKKYIGKHKGSTSDGYICSSEKVLEEIENNPAGFIRTILAYGTDEEMLELETMLIMQLKATRSGMYYNLSNNLRKD